MQCLKCKGKVESDWVFCPNCGKARPLLKTPLSDANIDEVYDAMLKKEPASDKPDDVIRFETKITPEEHNSTLGSIRDQVFEVIVRQALAGAPWQAICAGPMLVNKISHGEVQREVDRRKAKLAGKDKLTSNRPPVSTKPVQTSPSPPSHPSNSSPPPAPAPPPPVQSKNQLFSFNSNLSKPVVQTTSNQPSTPSQKLAKLRTAIINLSVHLCEQEDLFAECSAILVDVDKLYRQLAVSELRIPTNDSESNLAVDLQRELDRVKRSIESDGNEGPHPIKS